MDDINSHINVNFNYLLNETNQRFVAKSDFDPKMKRKN